MYTRAAPHTSVPDARPVAQEASAMSVSRGVEWGVLLGMRKIETVEQMPEEYRQVILKLLSALASTEFASVVHEEKFHASFGARRVADVVRSPEYARLCGAGKDEVQQAVDKWYPRALDTF